ncbi:endonuclease/exonuclease/phosphatase family protein [Sediminihabitans luteus]|uniref:endonuclease/exonuclease/phosphatase family protein n=1 Tax=Sediminihabitans luteus TaxID=1138585 RepID=UPI000C231EB2|nr:endonuclease/exonuclease/phosphatase family protein [Sediminihabitans luteus]
MLTIASWNMNQRDSAWSRLDVLAEQHDVSVALLQEARRPADARGGWQLHPPVEDAGRWRIAVPGRYRAANGSLKPTRRHFASAIASREGLVVPRDPSALHEVVDGEFARSHPGQFAVGDIQTDRGARVTVISLYGICDRMLDSGTMYPEATLHRAISDLTPIFQERASDYVLVAGDLNLYSYSDGTIWGRRGMTVFERLAAYGLDVLGPFRRPDEPRLERCPCPDVDCRHVITFLYQSNPKNRPHQLDFFLATPRLRDRRRECWADPDLEWPQHSDHRPILTAFDV